MYQNVLIPIDPGHEERHKLAYDVALALGSTESRITAMTVIEPIPAYAGFGSIVPELESTVKKNVQDSLSAFAADKNVATQVLHGAPGTAIVEYAKSNDVDCIVIASHKPGFGDFLIGSTAARVVRHAPCSVHVVR